MFTVLYTTQDHVGSVLWNLWTETTSIETALLIVETTSLQSLPVVKRLNFWPILLFFLEKTFTPSQTKMSFML